MRRWWIVLALVALAALAATRFWPTVTTVEVSGNEHYDRAEILRRARLAPGDPLLWVTRWRVRGLENDPWIARARVIRHWPDAVSVRVWEREPLAWSGERTWAEDGTVLGMTSEAERDGLVRIEGWGAAREEEALELARLLQPFEPEVIQYSPNGFEVTTADTVLFTPSVELLRRHWAALESRRGGRMAVYPWGVSKADE